MVRMVNHPIRGLNAANEEIRGLLTFAGPAFPQIGQFPPQ
jgi:hypothetical protein